MNKTILITGGSRGIGRATSEKFLENGYVVIATSTSGNFDYEHENLITHKYDQSDSESINELVDWLKSENHSIDVLINNAGILLDWNIDTVKIDIFEKTIAVNLRGLIDLTEKTLSLMNEDGLIINMSSGLGALSEEMGTIAPAYSVSKTGVNMYTKKLHAKVSDKGLTVVSYEPGWVKTDMGGKNAPREVSEPADELYELSIQNPRPISGLFYNGDGVREW